MSLTFGGQMYQVRCPLCGLYLKGRRQRSADLRIQAAQEMHLEECGGRLIDPLRLSGMSYEEASAELERLTEPETAPTETEQTEAESTEAESP